MDTIEFTIRVQVPEGANNQLIDQVRKYTDFAEKAISLFAYKNYIYGNSIQYMGLLGANYQLLGGAIRLHNLMNNAVPNDFDFKGTVRDILVDLMNYSAIGMLMLEDNNIQGSSL